MPHDDDTIALHVRVSLEVHELVVREKLRLWRARRDAQMADAVESLVRAGARAIAEAEGKKQEHSNDPT